MQALSRYVSLKGELNSRREDSVLYEIRHYDAVDGRFDAMKRRFETEVVPRFAKHGIELLGAFTSPDLPGRMSYITRYPEEEARQRAWASFGADPDWKAAKAASETDGPLLAQQTITILNPTLSGLTLS
jgi:hypothetical protein